MKYKNYLIAASAVLFAVVITSFKTDQQEKEYTLKLTQSEISVIYQTIDDAAIDGKIRKPLLQKIASQFGAQNQPPAPADTTKPKSKKP